MKKLSLPNNINKPKNSIYKGIDFIYKDFSFKSSEFLKSVYKYTKSYTNISLSGYLSALSARIHTLLIHFYINIHFMYTLCLRNKFNIRNRYNNILKCNTRTDLNIYYKLYYRQTQYLYISSTYKYEKLRKIDGKHATKINRKNNNFKKVVDG